MSTANNSGNSGTTAPQNKPNKTAPNKVATTTTKKSALPLNGLPELEGCVFDYGGPLQAYQFAKKIDNLGNHCGKQYGKAMRLLVHGQESPPEEPIAPITTRANTNDWQALKYDKQMGEWTKQMTQYEKDKSKVYDIICGQCTLSMMNKLKSTAGFQTINEAADVIGLLNMIKNITFDTDSNKYKYYTITQCIRRMLLHKQQKTEDLAQFYQRWNDDRDVLTSNWGTFVPKNLDANDNETVESNKLLACMFLDSLYWPKYGRYVTELNNDYVAGHDNYPATVEEAVNQLTLRSEYEGGNNRQQGKNPKQDDQSDDNKLRTSFAQVADTTSSNDNKSSTTKNEPKKTPKKYDDGEDGKIRVSWV